MAEIRVSPQRRSRATVVLIIVAIALLAALVWYFLAGPGAAAAVGA
jgi:predicted nucleic acid-binding Zn ribbon protein